MFAAAPAPAPAAPPPPAAKKKGDPHAHAETGEDAAEEGQAGKEKEKWEAAGRPVWKVGERVKVYWDGEGQWFCGTVEKTRGGRGERAPQVSRR